MCSISEKYPPARGGLKEQHALAGWLTPSGRFYTVEEGNHIAAAQEIVGTDRPENLGWIKIMRGRKWVPPTRGLTEIQAEWLEAHQYASWNSIKHAIR